MATVTAAAVEMLPLPRTSPADDDGGDRHPASVAQEDYDALAASVAEMVTVTQRTLALSSDAEARLDLLSDHCAELELVCLRLIGTVGALVLLMVLAVVALA